MKKQVAKPQDKEKIEIRENFQAVLLADTYVTRMAPVTLETPKCLLPVANVPLIEYTIAWLQANKINEVIVVYTAHSEKIEEYFSKREKSVLKFTLVHAHEAKSVGDALREVQYKGIVYGDFVLVYGDMVSNMQLQSAIRHFLSKKREDSLNIMTDVLRTASCMDSGRSVMDDDYGYVIDSSNGDILQVENMQNEVVFNLNLERLKVSKGAAKGQTIRYDLLDTQVYICSMDVLKAFQENFTFNSFTDDFVKELLTAEINEEKISSFILPLNQYSIRAADTRLYYKVNQAVIQRKVHPFTVKKMLSLQKQSVVVQDINIYISKTASIAYGATISNNSCVGEDTVIGESSIVQGSVIGKGCKIGKSVKINGSIIQDNVIIEDGCIIESSLVCSGAVVKNHSSLNKGTVIGFNVIVKAHTEIPSATLATKFEYDTTAISDNSTESATLFESGSLFVQLGIENESLMGYNQNQREGDFKDNTGFESDYEENSEDNEQEKQDVRFSQLAEDIRIIIQDSIADPSKTDSGTVEIHNLKVAENSESWKCIQIFTPEILSALENSCKDTSEPQERVLKIKNMLSTWKKLFRKFVHSLEDSLILILEIEKFCIASKSFYDSFHIFLQLLFQDEILTKEYILNWVSERRDSSNEQQKHFLELCKDFIEWLESDSEEEEEEDQDEDK